MRHVVPVDGCAGPGQVRADREAESATLWHRRPPLEEPGLRDNLINALLQAAARDPQPVDGSRVRLRKISPPELDRVEPELFGDLVEVDLESESRLRRAMATLRSARRLVREQPNPLETVARNRVGRGLQCTRVVGRRDAIAAVATAVQEALELHGRDPAIPTEAGFHLHLHRVPATVG